MNLLSLMYTVGLLGQDRWDPQNYFLLILVLLSCQHCQQKLVLEELETYLQMKSSMEIFFDTSSEVEFSLRVLHRLCECVCVCVFVCVCVNICILLITN